MTNVARDTSRAQNVFLDALQPLGSAHPHHPIWVEHSLDEFLLVYPWGNLIQWPLVPAIFHGVHDSLHVVYELRHEFNFCRKAHGHLVLEII